MKLSHRPLRMRRPAARRGRRIPFRRSAAVCGSGVDRPTLVDPSIRPPRMLSRCGPEWSGGVSSTTTWPGAVPAPSGISHVFGG